MKPAPATTTLTPDNSKSIVKLAALMGWTPDKLANVLLAEGLGPLAGLRVSRIAKTQTDASQQGDVRLMGSIPNLGS